MTEITLCELLSALPGTSPRDIDNWLARLPLKTKYAPTVRGRRRTFTRDNALELSFLSHMVRGGMMPKVAALVAAEALDWLPDRKSRNERFNCIFDDGRPSVCVEGAVVTHSIDARRIIDRVDQLF
jgi:hypothetical protein